MAQYPLNPAWAEQHPRRTRLTSRGRTLLHVFLWVLGMAAIIGALALMPDNDVQADSEPHGHGHIMAEAYTRGQANQYEQDRVMVSQAAEELSHAIGDPTCTVYEDLTWDCEDNSQGSSLNDWLDW